MGDKFDSYMPAMSRRLSDGLKRPGDQRRTAADIAKAHARLGYDPKPTVREGLAAQLTWQQEFSLTENAAS